LRISTSSTRSRLADHRQVLLDLVGVMGRQLHDAAGVARLAFESAAARHRA
jgi:hypothetical protein